jgi:hypothetical protein
MTLILSYLTPSFALQISDRLVTQDRTRHELDPWAIKSIVFRAGNGIVSIGFSGLALIGTGEAEQATDHWIVEQLVGGPIHQAMTIGRYKYRYDLGYAMKALCEAMNANRAFRSNPIDVRWGGFQADRRGRGFPVTGAITRDSGAYVARHQRARDQMAWGVVATPMGVVDERKLCSELVELGPEPDAAERHLVETMRVASRSSRVIGEDCMSVMLSPKGVRVRYDGRRPTVVDGRFATPTPWIVTSGIVSAPERVAEDGTRTLNGLPVQVDVPTAPLEAIGRTDVTVLQMERRKWGPRQFDGPLTRSTEQGG